MTEQVCVSDLFFGDRIWNSGSVTFQPWSIWPITQLFWALAYAGMVIIIPVPYSSWTYYLYPREQTDAEAEAPYFDHLVWKTDSLEKTLMLGKIEGRRRRGQQRMRRLMASLTRWIWVWASSRSWWWTGKPGMLQSVGSQRVRHDWVTNLRANVNFFINFTTCSIQS